MKKVFTFLLLMAATHFMSAQTLHKQYPINYCGTGYCHQTTIIHGGRYYVAFVEDSSAFPGNNVNLTLLKNDLNGNVIWKRTYQFATTYTATAAPRKIVASGANLYIGGNLVEAAGQYPFITSIDTTNGNVNYFNKYASSFSSTDIKINDLALLNNGDVMAVGRIMSGVNKFFYALRVVGNTGAIVNNGMSTYYTDQEAFGICQFNNSSIFIVGQRGLYPFIAKLNNNSALTPVGAYTISTGGMPPSSTFNQIIKSGNYLVVMGAMGGSSQNNFISKIDTNVNTSASSVYVLQVFTGNTFIPTYIVPKGSMVMASGVTAGGNSVLFFDYFGNYSYGKAYGSTGSMDHSLLFNNNHTYLTTGTWNTGSNLRLYKGDSAAYTSCATNPSFTYSVLSVPYSVGQIGVFTSGSITSVTPQISNKPITPITTCLSTGVEEIVELAGVQLLTAPDKFILQSNLHSIHEIIIYDMNGRIIESRLKLNSNQEEINAVHLAQGMYLAKVNYGNQQKVFKLIKN